jgi:hypothetical protein
MKKWAEQKHVKIFLVVEPMKYLCRGENSYQT